LFRTSPDAALVTTISDRTICMVNDSFTRLTGFTAEEATGSTTTGLNLYVNAADQSRLYQIAEQQGKIENEVVDFRRKDGSLFRGMVNAVLFRSGEEAYIATHVRDLTRELQQQRKSEKKDEEYRRLFETMAQGVIYQNASGNIISANPAAERMLGLPHEEMLSRTSLHPEWHVIDEDGKFLPGSEHPTMIALSTGKTVGPRTIGVMNPQNDRYVWLSVCATPLFHAGENKPYQVYVVMNDITAEREAQHNYEQLFREMLDGFALHEILLDDAGKPVDYRYLAVNPAFERMTGLKSDDLVGKTVLEVMPDTEQYWIETYGAVALTGQPVKFQNYASALDKYFIVTAYRPAPMQFACTFSDITTQVRAQLEIKRAQKRVEQLAHICDIAPSSIIIFNEEGTILYTNEYTARMHDYTKEELAGKCVQDITGNFNSSTFLVDVEAIRDQGEIIRRRDAIKRDGSLIPLLVFAKQIEWEGLPAILSIGTELTAQIKAERSLQNSLDQNKRILDNLQDGFYQSKFDGTLLMLNPRMAEMYGFPSVEEMLRVNAKTLYFDVSDRVAMLEKLHADGKVTNYVCRGKRGDGSLVWVSMHVQYLKDAAGEIIGSEGLIRDITERQQMEQEIQLQHESLLASNEILKKRLEQSINAISMIGELRDVYTAGHQRRVRQLACEIGRRCGLSEEAISNLSYGALIHDIGKIKIASDILNKPGKITNLEYQILQTHAEYSYSIVREMDLPNEILTMIHQHHERLDGSGYPNQLAGDQIILESRILAVADVVEAMTSHRPYRPALGIDAALAEIESGRGVKYDAAIVDHCVSLFREQGFVFQADPDT
jgi:PAS domain S-box-containing protein